MSSRQGACRPRWTANSCAITCEPLGGSSSTGAAARKRTTAAGAVSGATSTQSTSAVGSSYFLFNATSDYFNSMQCSIPKASGAGANQQSGVNGVLWLN